MNTRASAIAIAAVLLISLHPAAGAFQHRDHLTPQEVDLVKDTQILDKRIEVFIKAAERRLLVLTGTGQSQRKATEKGLGEVGRVALG